MLAKSSGMAFCSHGYIAARIQVDDPYPDIFVHKAFFLSVGGLVLIPI